MREIDKKRLANVIAEMNQYIRNQWMNPSTDYVRKWVGKLQTIKTEAK